METSSAAPDRGNPDRLRSSRRYPPPPKGTPVHPPPVLVALALLVPLATGQEGDGDPPGSPPQAPPQAGPHLGTELAAWAGDVLLPFAELDELLIWRHGRSPQGLGFLRQLIELRVLEQLAAEQGLTVGEERLRGRLVELDGEIRSSGKYPGLAAFLEAKEVDEGTFREYLRLAILHEELTRRALGLGPDQPASAEQQRVWLDSVMAQLEIEQLPHPWTEGVVVRLGEQVIARPEFSRHLRTVLPRDDLETACHQLLLEKRVRARMPDMAEAALERAIEQEIDRRREQAQADERYKGARYEDLLSAQGLSLESLRRDPAVRVAALARIWIERTCDEQTLRRVYADEREAFDGRFGEAIEVSALLLKAARFKNDLNPRTFEEAESELRDLRSRMQGAEDFQRLSALHSEDPVTREHGGRLGLVTRGVSNIPAPIREATFSTLEGAQSAGGGEVAGTILGPLRVQGGVVLVLLGARRPAPTWEVMSAHVQREMRRRFLDELLPRGSVATWLDSR